MSTQKEAISQELDSKFVVSDYLSSNPPVPMPLISAIQAMTVPQRFQVEQAMNEIVSKQSEAEQKAYLERCKMAPDLKIVEFSTHERLKTFRIVGVNAAAQVLLQWLQQYSAYRLYKWNVGLYPRIVLFNRRAAYAEIRNDDDFYVNTIEFQPIVDKIGRKPDKYQSLYLTSLEVDQVLESTINDTEMVTLNDCIRFIVEKQRINVQGDYLEINFYDSCTEIK